MPYITVKQSPAYHQITFEEILADIKDLSKYVFSNPTNTRTYYAKDENRDLLEDAVRRPAHSSSRLKPSQLEPALRPR